MNMGSHLHRQVNRKVSDFIVGEAGKVGSRSAFTAAAFIGAISLAGVLFSAPNTDADGLCGGSGAWCGDESPWCCSPDMGDTYFCSAEDIEEIDCFLP